MLWVREGSLISFTLTSHLDDYINDIMDSENRKRKIDVGISFIFFSTTGGVGEEEKNSLFLFSLIFQQSSLDSRTLSSSSSSSSSLTIPIHSGHASSKYQSYLHSIPP